MTLEQLTDQLAGLYRAGRRYEFVEQAHGVLAQVGRAPGLVELTLRALLELGLGGPARELRQLRPEVEELLEGNAGLTAALAEAPNGRVPWSRNEAILRTNVAALLKDRPQFRRLADELHNHLAGIQLYRTAEGHDYISRRQPGRLREWLPALTVTE
ncbi:MAG: hypothetical protein GY842_23250, partial [bacterium]|nr:hypothetical protein [bacterium]